MPIDCKQFEQLLADALGDELSDADRALFDAHLTDCGACRSEYQSLAGAIETVQTRLTLPDALAVSADSAQASRYRPASGWAITRYAAAIAFAFLAGYLLRGTNPPAPAPDSNDGATAHRSDTVQEQLVIAHQRAPQASSFAKSMLAVMGSAASDSP